MFDARSKFAFGGLPFDYPGFAHTVLVDMRARLAHSDQPRRISGWGFVEPRARIELATYALRK